MLDNPKTSVRRECCWIISNICGGTLSQVAQTIKQKNLLAKVAVMFHQDDPIIRKEICYVFKNMAHNGEKESVLATILSLNVTESVVSMLGPESSAEGIEAGLQCLF